MPFSSINNFTCIGGSRKNRQVGCVCVCVCVGGGLDNVCLAINVFHRGQYEGVLLILEGGVRTTISPSKETYHHL